MNGYYALVIDAVKQHDYRFLRAGAGSHESWTHGRRKQTVPRNMPSRHIANAVMKQAGIAHRF